MSISTTKYNHVAQNNCVYEQGNKSTIKWCKADKGHITNYEKCLDYMLSNHIDLCKPVFYCKDWKCECHKHKHEIDMLCNAIIDSCIVASQRTTCKWLCLGYSLSSSDNYRGTSSFNCMIM